MNSPFAPDCALRNRQGLLLPGLKIATRIVVFRRGRPGGRDRSHATPFAPLKTHPAQGFYHLFPTHTHFRVSTNFQRLPYAVTHRLNTEDCG
jgi:hypothetical protein